jgi:hypothetical protein
MSHRAGAFALALTIVLAAGYPSAVRGQVVIPAEQLPAAALVPMAGHPPVTVNGVVATFDPATDIFRLDDGRMVKLTSQSKIVLPVARAIRPGDAVVLHDVLPIGVQSGVKTLAVGQPQRMGTIASVDEDRGLVRLTDGTAVRVNRSTNVHLGAAGSNVALTQVSPGDELVVVLGSGGAVAELSPANDSAAPASALAREDASPPAVEAGEVMIFRVPRRP